MTRLRTAVWAVVLLGLYAAPSQTSVAECQVRCPDGMVCLRVEDSYFHLCIRPTPNTTSSITGQGGSNLGHVNRGRGDSQAACPRPPEPAGPCVVQCRYHNDCRPHQACCSSGCGYVCVSTTPDAVTKPGSCPNASRLDAEPCGSRCQGDGDCPGRSKCCRSRCGMTCQAPCFHWLSHTGLNPWRLSHRCGGDSHAGRRD